MIPNSLNQFNPMNQGNQIKQHIFPPDQIRGMNPNHFVVNMTLEQNNKMKLSQPTSLAMKENIPSSIDIYNANPRVIYNQRNPNVTMNSQLLPNPNKTNVFAQNTMIPSNQIKQIPMQQFGFQQSMTQQMNHPINYPMGQKQHQTNNNGQHLQQVQQNGMKTITDQKVQHSMMISQLKSFASPGNNEPDNRRDAILEHYNGQRKVIYHSQNEINNHANQLKQFSG